MFRIITFLCLILLAACQKSSKNNNSSITPFELIDSKKSNINFQNKVEDQEKFNVLNYRNYYNGGGTAIGDFNNDGLKDIYFTANMSDNKLYLNKGDFKFEDITIQSGVKGKESWSTGVTLADVNADGFLDIYVCYSGDAEKQNKENELFINDGNKNGQIPTFKEKAKEYGLNDAGLSTHASFFDYDLDGDLDCYVLNNSYKDPERISLYSRERFEYDALGGDRLYKNENGKFINVTKESKIFSSNIGFGLGISVGDVNNDSYPDIYISNDFWERDYLYINQKNGTFKETLPDNMSYSSLSSMGSDIADVNNDGHLDIFTTDMLPADNYRLKAATKFDDYYLFDLKFRNSYYFQFLQNCLQINNGTGNFKETAHFSGVAATDWSWGALIFDMNLDGLKDIYVSNGVYHDITDSDFMEFIADKDEIKKVVEKNGRFDFRDFSKFLPNNKKKNYAFFNKGNLKFSNEAENFNLNQESYSNGSAFGDLDNDGDFDLVVNNVNMEAFIYKNNAVENKANFLKIKLEGSEKNKFGIGSKVTFYTKNESQVIHSTTSKGFQSSSDIDLIFGLGNQSLIDSIKIEWPTFETEIIKSPKINNTIIAKQSNAKAKNSNKIDNEKSIFDDITFNSIKNAIHIENNYVDFDSDRLMPHVLSNEGPKIIKGDVNNDKKIDFILLGAKGNPDKLFLNKGNQFVFSNQNDFNKKIDADRISGALFDADGDNDQDYIVGMGGNEYKGGIKSFAVQFYENDGNGNFKVQEKKCPQISGQIGTIKPIDIDKDGDLDLFAGGKAIPGVYGLTPRSFVMQNDGNGNWTDITNANSGPLGMVTDAVWSDINKDSWPDLVVVGEWMPISILLNENGVLSKPTTISNSNGWWNTIEAADTDQDGDEDFLIGNWGTNMKLKASESKPLNLYINDFDDNKRMDVLMEWYGFEDAKPYPFASKNDLTGMMPSLKKTILKYQDYAKKQISDLFDEKKIEKAIKKTVNNFNSSVLINQDGKFVLENLPDEAQMSPIFSIKAADLDGDNVLDFFAGGNFYRLKPEIGRHDGFHGGYFKGLGKGKFKYINEIKSGIKIKGEVRDSQLIDNKLIIARNNESLLIFK